MVTQLARIPNKELMIKQELANVTLQPAQLELIDTFGHMLSFTPTGAVVNSLGGKVMCLLDGRFLMENTRFDHDKNMMITDFKLDEDYPNIVCNNITNNPSTMRCSLRHDEKATAFYQVHFDFFHTLCVDQMKIVLESEI